MAVRHASDWAIRRHVINKIRILFAAMQPVLQTMLLLTKLVYLSLVLLCHSPPSLQVTLQPQITAIGMAKSSKELLQWMSNRTAKNECLHRHRSFCFAGALPCILQP